MAVMLEFHYDKRLGLPGYSSHDFGVTLKTEITNLDQIEQESEKAYRILQQSVDSQIIHQGYVPDQVNNSGEYNQAEKINPSDEIGRNKHYPKPEEWNCTERQKDLIMDILNRNDLTPQTLNELALEIHNKDMEKLSRFQVSAVITELLSRFGKRQTNGRILHS